jgi:hypothetical protein
MAAGFPRDQAQADICQVLADRTVRCRFGPQKHAIRLTISKAVLDGKDVQIPVNLKPEDLDWERSCPAEPWAIRREIFGIPGFWHFEWIELSRTDVADVLCTPGRPGSAEKLVCPGPRPNVGPQKPEVAGPVRRRGPRPRKSEQTMEAMRDDIRQGRRTMSDLEEMLEKDLAAHYGVSRDTARKARSAVLSEMKSRQIPTNDK